MGLGSPPRFEEEIIKNLDPAIEMIRKKFVESGVEKRVEEFLAAVRFTMAPPLIQQTGIRKSMADRLSFQRNKPQTLSLDEMKNKINSLKDTQQRQQVLEKRGDIATRGRGRGGRGNDRDVGHGRGGIQL